MDKKELILGVIGLSEGNGHPYSWSALLNGYNKKHLEECDYPAIPGYLEQNNASYNGEVQGANVKYIWTQDKDISEHISKSCKIKHVVNDFKEMIDKVDAILLARDDSENHYNFAEPFLKKDIPIYIDKPIATSISSLDTIFSLRKYDWQIYTCSALRYAEELTPNYEKIGDLLCIDAEVPKSWEKYSVHVIDKIVSILKDDCGFSLDSIEEFNEFKRVRFLSESNIHLTITATSDYLYKNISIRYVGTKGTEMKLFENSYGCFKTSLEKFIKQVSTKNKLIADSQVYNVVRMIELGMTVNDST